MAMTIEQQPAYTIGPAGTDWIFTLSSTNTSGNYKYKFLADLYIDKGTPSTFKIRLKFSPNDNEVGIINISDILQDYVNPDKIAHYGASIISEYKGTDASDSNPFPIHLIDKLSISPNSTFRITVKFGEEYSTTQFDSPTVYADQVLYSDALFYNAVSYNNEQVLVSGNYGINILDWTDKRYLLDGTTGTMLTNAPTDCQYIGNNEYSTLTHLNGYLGGPAAEVEKYRVRFYDSSGATLSTETVSFTAANGGYNGSSDASYSNSKYNIQYIGVGPANIDNWSTVPATWSYYEVVLLDGSSVEKSKTYTYKRRDADCKGFEKIRLTWLNKYGVWDYYTFTKKSIRTTKINRNYYSSIKGDWNSTTFTKHGGDRGRGVITTKALEAMTINSDWITTDEEAAWLEELFISPEVYILGDTLTHGPGAAPYGKFMTPVVITNNEYQRYTRVNDKVSQYSIDLEYSIDKKIQRA